MGLEQSVQSKKSKHFESTDHSRALLSLKPSRENCAHINGLETRPGGALEPFGIAAKHVRMMEIRL